MPADYRLALDVLAPYGEVFARMRRDDRVVPLAVGIREPLLASTHPDQHPAIRRALRLLVNSTAYQTALKQPGAKRHAIDGSVVESVSVEAREIATTKLKKNPGNRHDAQHA